MFTIKNVYNFSTVYGKVTHSLPINFFLPSLFESNPTVVDIITPLSSIVFVFKNLIDID